MGSPTESEAVGQDDPEETSENITHDVANQRTLQDRNLTAQVPRRGECLRDDMLPTADTRISDMLPRVRYFLSDVERIDCAIQAVARVTPV